MRMTLPRVNLTPRQWRQVGLAVAVCVAIAFAYTRVDVDEVHRRAAELNGPMVFVAITLLPLAGFPVAVLHMVAGVRFGLGLGFALVALSILLQLLASYGLVHLWRGAFARRLAGLRERLPRGAHGPVALFTMLLPGVPYFAKNYVLPLVGMPLGTYLMWCFPLHTVRSLIGIMFGEKSDELTPLTLAGFALYGIALMLACAWAFRRVREQLQDRPPTAGDRKRAA